jgi:formylglycine-generating enzyme required for sulfatase activity
MGSNAGASDGDERPVHRVAIAYRLAVGRTEVTFDEWDACISDGGCSYRPGDMGWGRGARPVINIGSGDIAAYLTWLQRKTGKRYRLLSEAEWEYAARAGSRSEYDFGADRAELCRHGNGADQATDYSWRNQACADGYAKLTAPVRSFAPNAWGLYDMIGNVWEWTSDCWHESYAGAPGDGSAWTTACAKPDRILRGGAFSVDPDKLRASYRYSFGTERMPFFGFRVARVMDE